MQGLTHISTPSSRLQKLLVIFEGTRSIDIWISPPTQRFEA